MSKKTIIIYIILMGLVCSMGLVQAKVYQCKENGKMLFKDKPCEKKQKIVESGSDMSMIIAEKIRYDKRCIQKIIRLVSKHSAKTLSNVEIGRWNGKKHIKAINQKVICNKQSGLTKEALSQSVKGEVIADWANMMQWTTKDRHTLRAVWGKNKVIKKVVMYREGMAMPTKPHPLENIVINKLTVKPKPKLFARKIEAKITAFSKKEYPSDFAMQQYIYKKQLLAYKYMLTVRDLNVKKIAKNEYSGDYAMQKYIYDKQKSAKSYMKHVSDYEIKKLAKREYTKDYSMQKYTYDKQLSAKRYMKHVDNAGAKLKATNRYPSDYSMQKYTYDNLAY